MNLYEKIWKHYTENTEINTNGKGGVFDLMSNSEPIESVMDLGSGVALNFRDLDRYYDYDYEMVYGKDTVALFDTAQLLEDNLIRAVRERTLNGILDEIFPEWREDWEIPNQNAAHYIDADDLREEFEFVPKGLDTFMGKFGYVRFSTATDLWEDPSYQKPLYDDPNQLKLPFEGI